MTLLRSAATGAAGLVLAGCASMMSPRASGVPAAPPAASGVAPQFTGAAPAAAPVRPEPAAPRPFDDVVQGATRLPGFLSLWRKDDKLWLEVPLEQLDRPFLFSTNVSHSIGERGLYAGQMGRSWLAAFRRIGAQQLQLVALNTDYVATPAPMKLAVEQGFSPSLLASATFASAPHPQRKSVLVDAAFLLTDIPGYATRLETAFRLPYNLDRGNSYYDKARADDDLATVSVRLHYGLPRVPAPPATPTPTAVPPPRVLPDVRSLFVGHVYSFMRLPGQPMRVRPADPRLGHFSDPYTDFSDDLKANPRVHPISRWRLEKADPAAAVSPPKQPIVFWLDRNIPAPYRPAVAAGVLEWNKAFERIGFQDAIVVRQQQDGDDFDTLDARHASIRWYVGRDAGVASGPHQSDPRTGEIMDADIVMSDAFGRGARRVITEDLAGAASATATAHVHDATCDYAHEAATELGFALDLLEARGDLAADGPEAEALVQSVIKDTITHEVGHTLGLKHNFKASTVVTRAQLRDRAFTEAHGVSGSVMDYNAFNLPLAGERPSTLNNTTLGPYDFWAIEYAYKPLSPSDEAVELERIAARSATDPRLVYADDVEASNDGADPLVNRFDLGDDPLAYHQRRLALAQELWQRVQARPQQPGDEITRARRVLMGGFRQLQASAALVGKYVGGMHTARSVPGAEGPPAYWPVDPDRQREALRVLAQGVFSADTFRFEPRFLASLAPDYNEWERSGPVSIPGAVLGVQIAALDRLMSASTATRVLELPFYVETSRRRDLFSLAEVYGGLQDAVWSELRTGRAIDPLRRNLQREHLKRVIALLVRPAPLPPDALSLLRHHATALQALLRAAAGRPRAVVERAHLEDSLALLTEALRATMVRS